jgi:hypothetical protein
MITLRPNAGARHERTLEGVGCRVEGVVTQRPPPQSVACGFPARRSSEHASHLGIRLPVLGIGGPLWKESVQGRRAFA